MIIRFLLRFRRDKVLTQVEADALIAVEKHRVDDEKRSFPHYGEKRVLF